MSWYCAHPGCSNRGTWRDEDQIARAAERPARDAAEQAIVTELTGVF